MKLEFLKNSVKTVYLMIYRPDNINNPPVGANDIFKIWKILENNNNDEKRFAENREIIIMRDFFAPKAREKSGLPPSAGHKTYFIPP